MVDHGVVAEGRERQNDGSDWEVGIASKNRDAHDDLRNHKPNG